jgi:radical SAM protein with 4Fe4S-binding SPASM domain
MFHNIWHKIVKLKNNIFFSDFNYCLTKGKIFPPYYVLWDCSRKCNLNCVHCGAVKEKYDKELTTEQIKGLINQLAKIKVRFFAATGGEPLLRKDILEVMKYASEKGIKTGLATNGYFIDEGKAKEIRNAGISSIQISLDGTEETHNKIRGNNLSFQKAIKAIRLLQEQKLKLVSVATTITPMNFNDLKELKKILLELGVKNWRICIIMPIGRAERKKLLLNSKQLRELLEFVSSNKDKLKIQIGENLPFLAEYEKKIRKSPLICPVGFTACCVGVDGNVRGCPEMPDVEKFREGSILEKPFIDIWRNEFKKYRSREIIETDKKCMDCENKRDCYGGCWVMRGGNIQCIYELLK